MDEVQGKVNGHGQTNGTQAIVSAPAATLTAAYEETSEQLLARANQQIALHQGIIRLIAANISPLHVMLFGDNIWLTKDACLRILGWVGADILPDGEIKANRHESNEGPYIEFETWGTVTLRNGRKVRAMGNCSTLDDFFAKRSVNKCSECGGDLEWRTIQGSDKRQPFCIAQKKTVRYEKTDYYLPLTEVDVPSVRQKALTNFYNHALQVLGVMPTKEELIAAGMHLGEGGKVDFKKEQKSSSQQPQTTGQKPQSSSRSEREASPKEAAVSTPEQPKPAAASPQPEKKKPEGSLVSGVIESAYLNKGQKENRYVKMTVKDGDVTHTLHCFHDSVAVTSDGDKNLLELLVESRKKNCTLIVAQQGKWRCVEGARKIGFYEWDEDGMPVDRREPGEDPKPYEAIDEDVPF